MRYISKQGDGGYHLTQANTNPPQTAETATSRWSSFGDKTGVRECLLYEQYQLCCYSEVRADLLGLGYHIEHVENKRQRPERTFDYTNLAASALTSYDLGAVRTHNGQGQHTRPQAVFGGHAQGKQQTVDMQNFISPHQADCPRFFSFLSDGRIVAKAGLSDKDHNRAQYTIDLLNLNSPFLLTERRKWWGELEELFEEHIQEEMDLRCLAAVDLLPRNQALQPFFSLTRQFFGATAEDVLQQQAVELV